ncbi:MAG: twin-arginine translocase TatA/TatE family subunit [SAR324 cluster bacterium]|uniref:Sec-independent protein translocase protein TatA n=1 Tax=SAR324 cluster bacterium TaxID=2024889 RepID=A0A7X9FQ95_9DELT|nr:twin-arginine translocase TatA/TatE family subunit [SAR324 cluster bacterium]
MGGLSIWHWLVVAVVIVILFGKRLPELGTSLGQAISNFKKAYKEGQALDVTPKQGELENKKEDSD